jgi:hypothetical protein
MYPTRIRTVSVCALLGSAAWVAWASAERNGASERQIGLVAPAVVVTGLVLTDNGDDDGWADTNETVQARPRLWNRSGAALTNVITRLSTSDPKIACVSDDTVSVGGMSPDEIVLAPAFTVVVEDVQRTATEEMFTANFTIEIDADQLDDPQTVAYAIDLDLDATGGSGEDSFIESFESATLGKFALENLDAGLSGWTSGEGLANADGYRCQYNDPDWVNSVTYNTNEASTCFPGVDPTHAAETFWRVDGATIPTSPDGGRAWGDTHSLYYGLFLSNPAFNFSTPMGVLEAVRTDAPINVNYGKVERVSPELSFYHQLSLVDHRANSFLAEDETIDRAVVQVQTVDPGGEGLWTTLEAYRNPYHACPFEWYSNCSFDPIDDGTTEDDFFDPTDPGRRLGPSSTCGPRRVYAHLGDTGLPFDPAALGDAIDGPGLAGSLGMGTWVESRFSLERFRGRRIRIRFLGTSLKSSFRSWEQIYQFNPTPNDDGWWIDDVTVSDTLEHPASLAVDVKDNSLLRSDADLDGTVDSCDCAPLDPDDLAPGELTSLTLTHSGGVSGVTILEWASAGPAALYDSLRSESAASFASAVCLESMDGSDTSATDSVTPPAGEVAFFLVRARNTCGTGPLSESQGQGPDCA